MFSFVADLLCCNALCLELPELPVFAMPDVLVYLLALETFYLQCWCIFSSSKSDRCKLKLLKILDGNICVDESSYKFKLVVQLEFMPLFEFH